MYVDGRAVHTTGPSKDNKIAKVNRNSLTYNISTAIGIKT